MKKIFTMLMVMCMIMTLTACGCEHEWLDATCQAPMTCKLCDATEGEVGEHAWADATCDSPKTCNICNTTEGEALTHDWIDADCDTAKTCTLCETTDGETLGHDMAEANYQQPATCKTCGYTEGEALPAGFEASGLTVINAEMGVEYDYITTCYDNKDYKTTGKLTLSNYQTFESAEGYDAVDGYEWHSVQANILFSDENAQNYGMMLDGFNSNFFQPTPWGEPNTVNFNGVDYDKCDTIWGEWTTDGWNMENKTITYTVNITWRVPVGYDGYLFGFYDGGIEPVDGQYIWEFMNPETLVFRFPATDAE